MSGAGLFSRGWRCSLDTQGAQGVARCLDRVTGMPARGVRAMQHLLLALGVVWERMADRTFITNPL